MMQHAKLMSHELTPEQWNQLLSLLSLDGALPLYEAMGVPVADKDSFQKILRDVIIDARRRFEVHPEQVPPVASMLFHRLGSTAAEPFAAWARGAFLGYHADQPDWSAWDIVMSHWAYSRSQDLDFLPEQKRESFVSGYREKAESGDVKRKGLEMLNKALSDWDLDMFARRRYGISWESSPYSTAEAIARIERLKRFAREVWQGLSPSEKEEFQQRAQALIDELEVWMPGLLPGLDTLLKEL